MGLKLELVGQKFDPVSFSYTKDDVILYALGIGAGVDNELDFLYEKNLKVFPTFAMAPLSVAGWEFPEMIGMNLFTVLHGEQKVEFHAPIPTDGTIVSTSMLESIYDKGDSGAVANNVTEVHDEAGNLLYVARAAIFDRGAGNFGGDRGPKSEKIVPPEGKEPDFRVEYTTSVDQAALYRLSGDKNPLHIDPEFAAMGNLPKPILHGLCTYGIAGRAILHEACDSDPAKLKSFSVRFAGVVFPGETLITEGWKIGDNVYAVRTSTGDGRVVLSNCKAETA